MGIRLYGTSDDKNLVRESTEAREISAKIMDYGVSQRQLLFIIDDLVMNLENREHIKLLKSALNTISKDAIIETTSDGLIV